MIAHLFSSADDKRVEAKPGRQPFRPHNRVRNRRHDLSVDL